MQPASERPLLVVDDLYVSYGKREILQGVSFALRSGEVVALLGGNGSGKSTLFKALTGLIRPSRGALTFDGRDIRDLETRQRQALGISYLIQGGRVFSNLTVSENFWIAIAHSRQRGGQSAQQLGEVFPELADLKDTRAGLLSGGQRQMLAIEMVLAQRSRIALLDEPSGGLAASAAARVLERIAEVSGSQNLTVLLAEQNVKGATSVSHRQIRLEFGTVAPSMPPGQVQPNDDGGSQ